MKKIVFTFIFCAIVFFSYSQNEVKVKELTSPIMVDFLKNYQKNNTIRKELVTIFRIDELKKKAQELKNMDNLTIIKPDLTALIKMPIIDTSDNKHYRMSLVKSDTNKLQPIK